MEPFQFRDMVVSVLPVTTKLVGAVGRERSPPGDAAVMGPMKSSTTKKAGAATPTTSRKVCRVAMICFSSPWRVIQFFDVGRIAVNSRDNSL